MQVEEENTMDTFEKISSEIVSLFDVDRVMVGLSIEEQRLIAALLKQLCEALEERRDEWRGKKLTATRNRVPATEDSEILQQIASQIIFRDAVAAFPERVEAVKASALGRLLAQAVLDTNRMAPNYDDTDTWWFRQRLQAIHWGITSETWMYAKGESRLPHDWLTSCR
jgi:hypothetical protein